MGKPAKHLIINFELFKLITFILSSIYITKERIRFPFFISFISS